MNKCDLESIFFDLAKKLPVNSDGGKSFIFTSENFPIPDSLIETTKLYVKKGEHVYAPSFRTDSVTFFAHKETYKYLGLLILSTVFHSESSEICIKINHTESDISNLIVEYEHPSLDQLCSGYHTKPFAFKYYPSLPARHPFDRCVNPENLPRFSLTNNENFLIKEEDWKNRDTVRIFGSDYGLVLFAELLLNAALPQNKESEYELEGESGFRGVGLSSAEVTLLLPGHIYWFDEHWS